MKRGQGAGSLAFIIFLALLLLGLLMITHAYAEEEIRKTLLDVSSYIAPAIWSIVILLAALLLRVVLFVLMDAWLRNYPLDLLKSLKQLLTVIIAGVSFLLILAVFTRDEMIFNIVIGGFIVALIIASKEFLEDFSRRFLLLSSPAINIGDTVRVEGVEGKVIEFGIVYTTIRTEDKALVSIPNKLLVEKNIFNYSKLPSLKVQDSVELSVDKGKADKIVSFIRKELLSHGFAKNRVECFKSGALIKFVASVNVDNSASIKHASQTLSKAFKKAIEKYE